MEALNDGAATRAYADAITKLVCEFKSRHDRAPTVLCVGVRGGSHAAAALAAGASEVVILSLDSTELDLAGDYLAAVGANAQGWSVLRRSPMQLVPSEHQFDMLVLDHFGALLNDHHAAIGARALWSRGIVRTFAEHRYVVPVEAAATVRLCSSPQMLVAAGYIVPNTQQFLKSTAPSPPQFKWRPHPSEVDTQSSRTEVLRERYDTAELDAIEWPTVIAAPPGPWRDDAVLLFEWAALLHPDQPPISTTSAELQRLSPRDRAARSAIWGAQRICALPPATAPATLTVSYRPGHGVSIGTTTTTCTSMPTYKQLSAARHARIADAEFAKACKIDNSASDL
jgi:hypothetical protein